MKEIKRYLVNVHDCGVYRHPLILVNLSHVLWIDLRILRKIYYAHVRISNRLLSQNKVYLSPSTYEEKFNLRDENARVKLKKSKYLNKDLENQQKGWKMPRREIRTGTEENRAIGINIYQWSYNTDFQYQNGFSTFLVFLVVAILPASCSRTFAAICHAIRVLHLG